jgi:hypothetical protein
VACRTTGSLILFGRPRGLTVSRPAGRGTLILVRPRGPTVSRPAGTGGRGPLILAFILADSFLLATVATIIIVLLLADLGSFRFGDEVVEEKAVLLLFKVEVVELNEEYGKNVMDERGRES